MSYLVAYRLAFKSPLHVSSTRTDYGHSESAQHSDTLYAAIIAAAHTLVEKPKGLLDADGGLNGITLSSLYPYSSSQSGYQYFLPIPFGCIEPDDLDIQKQLKKVKYADLYYFQRIQKKGVIPVGKQSIKDGFLCAAKGVNSKFIHRKVFPRVRVPRTGHTSDTSIYYIERIFFSKGTGLFLLALVEDKAAEYRLKGLLDFLGDEGIGTDTNVGHGFFEVERAVASVNGKPFDWNSLLEPQANYHTNLSLFLPENQEQLNAALDPYSRYQIIKRGGWITAPNYLSYRKSSIHMFQEGSLFKGTFPTAGKTVNLQPQPETLPENKSIDIPIYRSGRSLFLPINLNA